jgi:excinuclease ABC subunit C
MELQLFQRIRDEAHRFAITFHRKLRGKGMIKSFFDDIKGIGPKKKKNLMEVFNTFDELENASIEDLIRVKGINLEIAQEIYNRLHK